jgi:radical SAM superfamily enzyme YgiQ (UPF0313 family)
MLVINPSIHAESQSSAITPFIYNTFPTGIGVLAAYLRAYNGITPRIIDEQIEPLTDESLERAIGEDKEPKMVGFSLLTINSARAYQLAGRIKKIDPNVLIVAGGIHTVLQVFLQKESPGVRREGEVTLSEIARCAREGKSFDDLEGISYRRNGTFVHNPDRPVIEDLNMIPPFPYDLFEENRHHYRDFGTVITARGCPLVIFCSQCAITRRYRHLSIDRVSMK